MRQRIDRMEYRPVMGRAAALGGRLWDDLKALGALVLVWQARASERTRLAEMSDHMRRDLGLTEADIIRETHKPFWRP